jgi:polysaccharide pyruvyl transferase WcaK-like protein
MICKVREIVINGTIRRLKYIINGTKRRLNYIINGANRQSRYLIRTKYNRLKSARPTIIHLVHWGPKAPNRGDAVMSFALRQNLNSIRSGLNIVMCEISEIKNSNKPLKTILGPCDMVIIGGGGLYSKWFSFEPLLDLMDLKVPIVLYAIGAITNYGDDELSEEKLKFIKKINNIAAMSSVRDKMTQNFLRDLGEDARVIGDPGAFYNPGKLYSSINMKSEFHIGLNLPCHGFTSQDEVLQNAIPVLYEVAQNLSHEGIFLHYMKHEPREKKVINRLRDLPIHVCNGNVQQLLRKYFRLDLLIGGMLHSNIFAFNACVPFICLAYDKKHEAFLDLIDFRHSYLRLDNLSVENLWTKVCEFRENINDYKRSIKEARAKLWKDHEAFVRDILMLLS